MPLLFAALLASARSAIVEQRPTALSTALRFLWHEYRAGLFYWEVVELLRKEVLVGFLLLVPQAYTMVRLSVALLLTIGYLIILQAVRPYTHLSTGFVATATNLTLLILLLIGILLKFHAFLDPAESEQLFGEGDAFDALVQMTISANFVIIGASLLILVWTMRYQATRHTLRIAETHREPKLSLGARKQYHVFISHVWDNQDIAATIKARLQLLLPGIAVFLDVDDLRRIDELPLEIARSACLLVLMPP